MSGGDKRFARNTLNTFVGGLPFGCEDEELRSFMSQFGHISEIFIGRDTTTNVHKGYAFVTFSHVKDLKTLFGAHLFKGKSMEVKRNLHNHAILDRVAPEIKEKDIF